MSRTTVSRVLNDSGYVNEATRQRVLAVIEETGYVPSEKAKSLRTKQTKEIGVIVPKISTETASVMVEGIDEVLSEKGYQILLANTHLTHEKEIESVHLLKRKHVDGMILIATTKSEPLLSAIQSLSMPFVAVGQNIEGESSVFFDDYQATKDMVAALTAKGHTKIAFIGGPESDPAVGYLRKQAYMDALIAKNIPIDEAWIQQGMFKVQTGYEGMKNIWSSRKEKPTAIVTVTDRMAIGAIKFAMEIGLRIPNDIAITGMGASEMGQYTTPSITTIDFSYKEAGRIAARELLTYIEGKNKQLKRFKLPYRLLIRNSI